jgi:hypothetical protein
MRRAIIGLLLIAGCGPAGEGEGEGEGEAPFVVELGSGRERFVPLADGDTAFLERGFQGAQHVLVSVRAEDLPEDRYLVNFELVRDDGLLLSEPSRVRVPFESNEAGAQITGYRLVVGNEKLEDALGSTATLSATVEADLGSSGDERQVEVELAPEDYNPDA